MAPVNENTWVVGTLVAGQVTTPVLTGPSGGTQTQTAYPVAVTGSSLAATANSRSVVLTTESLATAAGSTFAYVLTNSTITAASNVGVTVSYGTATAGVLVVQKVVPAAGSVTITVLNLGATSPAGASINGTLVLFVTVN